MATSTAAESPAAPTLDQLTRAYERFVPHELLAMLGKKDATEVELGDQIEQQMTVLFCDIRDFTTLSESMSPAQNFAFINAYLSRMEPAIARHGGIVDKYVGDAIMALFPEAALSLRGALAMLEELDGFNAGLLSRGQPPLRIGIGINTGLLMLGIVGAAERLEGTVISDAVNLASRLEGETKTYGVPILISEHTLYAAGADHGFCVRFLDRARVKGKHRAESIYELFDHDPPPVREAKLASQEAFEEAVAYYHLREVSLAKPMFARCLDANPADVPARVYFERCQEFLKLGVHKATGELDEVVCWRQEYSIGVPEIDEQHRALFDRIAKASSAVKRADLGTIDDLMDFVASYVDEHFACEEQLMQSVGYPFALDHIREHRRFRGQFARLREEIAASLEKRLYLQFRVQLFLVDWAINHVVRRDGHIGRWLRHQRDV